MSQTGKILIVDDEEKLRFFLKQTLIRDGHQVSDVASGEAALAVSRDEAFDLALIDLNLPDMSGLEVLTHLHKRWPDMVLIILTAHASLDSSVKALRHGAHDYLFKPCRTVEIRESVRAGLQKRQQALKQRRLMQQLEQLAAVVQETSSTEVTIDSSVEKNEPQAKDETTAGGRFLEKGGFIVDFARYVITLNNQLLELSPTEFSLMAFLVSEAPRVLSPQELIQEVQGYATEQWEASEIIRQHVYRIRRKIKATTEQDNVIETVRGVGYTIKL